MKSIIAPIIVTITLAASLAISRAEELTWLTDLPKAQAQAKAEKKLVFILIHGSDWCSTCRDLQQQVIDTPEFKEFAHQALVLVDADFPESTPQSPELKKANAAIKEKFNLGDIYPSFVVLNDAGVTVFQESGYHGGGPAEVMPNWRRHVKSAPAAETARFKNLGVDEFAKLAADKQNVILDVRTSGEYKAGHLPGAVNLDVNAPDFKTKAAELDKNKVYLVHCQAGVRSTKACEILDQLEFPKLYNLTGGLKAWVGAGQPVEK
jgi:rhodanese-related sulfurtransferase/thioredoxin-related protein